jgi:uncharacterized OsmC-like protein
MSRATTVLDQQGITRLQAVIHGLVSQYQADPDAAQAEFRAKTRTLKDFETEAQSRDFRFTIDEPEVLGGTNKGPNPVEVLLGALGTCQQIVIAAYAAALGIELNKIEIDVRGKIDLRGLLSVAEVPSGFQSINFDATIEAKNATAAQLEQLKALALAHCPVLDTLQRAIPVTNQYRLESAAAPLSLAV